MDSSDGVMPTALGFPWFVIRWSVPGMRNQSATARTKAVAVISWEMAA